MDNPLTITTEENRLRFDLEFTRPGDAPQDIFRIQCRLEPFLEPLCLGVRENYALSLATEELVLNVAKYGGAPQDGTATLRCTGTVEILPDSVRFALEDNGGAFDPRQAPEPPIDLPPEERPIGGLGLHMMKQYFPELEYRRENGMNRSVWTMRREERGGE